MPWFGRRKRFFVTERLFGDKKRVAGPFRTREEAESKKRELHDQVRREYIEQPMGQSKAQMEENARRAMRDHQVEEE